MSTRLHHGHTLGAISLEEITQLSNRWRPELSQLRITFDAKFLAKAAVYEIDQRCLGLKTEFEGKAPLQAAAHELTTRRNRNDGSRDPEIDTDFEFSIHPHQGHVYALVYCEQQEFIESWSLAFPACGFAYWNATDRPEGISQSAWDRRGQIWDEILDRKAPAERGPVFHFNTPTPRPDNETIVAHVPQFEDRVHRLAHLLMMNDALFGEADAQMSQISRIYYDTLEDLKSPTPSADTKKAIETVLNSIPDLITEQMLTSPSD